MSLRNSGNEIVDFVDDSFIYSCEKKENNRKWEISFCGFEIFDIYIFCKIIKEINDEYDEIGSKFINWTR